MLSELVVEVATPADQETVSQLLIDQLREHAIDTPEEGVANAVAGMLVEPARGCVLVARRREQVIGVAYLSFVWALEHGGLSSWLEELYVVPEQRGQGIGSALLEAAVEQARAVGADAVDLEVVEGHDRAARLYLRNGFKRLPRTRYVRELSTAAKG